MQSNIESGVQLLARLSSKPKLGKLDTALFSENLEEKATLEITGGISSGKTLLLTKLLAICILPERHENIYINGCNAHAILINTDHHFQVSKLADLMRIMIEEACVSNGFQKLNSQTIRSIVETSLENFIIINCYNSDQFSITLHTLDNVLLSNNRIAMLAIDSISSYYWEDRKQGGVWSMNLYIKKLLKIIHAYTFQFNVVLIYTRPESSLPNDKDSLSCTSGPSAGSINYRIRLCKINSDSNLSRFSCTISSREYSKEILYVINMNGIQWEV